LLLFPAIRYNICAVFFPLLDFEFLLLVTLLIRDSFSELSSLAKVKDEKRPWILRAREAAKRGLKLSYTLAVDGKVLRRYRVLKFH
jgi:hypothetical protein